jgi:hypothetical protein
VLADIDIEKGLDEAWTNIAEFVPKLVGFLLILLIGWFIVKAIAKIVDMLLEKTKFDSAVQRGGIGSALARSKFDASDIIAKLIFWALFLLVLQMAFGVFGNNPISDLIRSVIAYIPKVVVAIIIIVIAAAIAAAVKEIVDAALGGLSYGKTLSIVASTAIVLVGVFAALDQLEIAPTIVSGLFYALLAIVVGSSIIAIGGGGIAPMRQRWENVMQKYDSEKPRLQQEMATAKDRVAQRAESRKQQVQSALQQPPSVK